MNNLKKFDLFLVQVIIYDFKIDFHFYSQNHAFNLYIIRRLRDCIRIINNSRQNVLEINYCARLIFENTAHAFHIRAKM